jgi:hypothetical protein
MERIELKKNNPRQVTEYLMKKHGHPRAYTLC